MRRILSEEFQNLIEAARKTRAQLEKENKTEALEAPAE